MISFHPPTTPLSSCRYSTHFADKETEAREPKNLPTATAGGQGQGLDSEVVFRQLLGRDQVLQVEMERKMPGSVRFKFPFKERPFLPGVITFQGATKKLFSQPPTSVTVPMAK